MTFRKSVEVTLFVVFLSVGFSFTKIWANIALRDLDKVSVQVNELDTESRKVGLDEQMIKDMVWQELEKEDLALPMTSSDKNNPKMHVFITAIKVMGGYAVSYRVHLRDWMLVPKSPSTKVQVTTWERGGLVSGGKKKVQEEVNKEVKKLTHLFIIDYLRANQKHRS